MALPDGGKMAWPPKDAARPLALMREWSAWWSGDPDQLVAVYGAGGGLDDGGKAGGSGGSFLAQLWYRFWGRQDSVGSRVKQRAKLHVPLASDISATSAALLFSEAPAIQVAEAHGKSPNREAKTAEERLTEILEEGGATNRLLEGADYASGVGGVYLKPAWDRAVADYPLVAVVQPDQALPEFRFGILTAVTLWREVEKTDRDVLRHLERHETVNGRGVVLHALYRGSGDELGERLSDEELAAKLMLEPAIELPFDGLGIRYVPNMRPNRRLRGSPLGQSDIAGAEGLLDALDESWASWIRDIRLGKARIVAPRDFLDKGGKFDIDHEIYSPIDSPGGEGEDKGLNANVSLMQAAIRVEEHSKTTLGLIERIVDHAGYAPQTFGLQIEGRAESGTALNIRERKTFLTQQRKAAWWGAAIADLCEMLLAIDRAVFEGPAVPVRPNVTMADSIAPDELQVATTVEMWHRAEAASIEVRVRAIHRDWEEEQVRDEVARIQAESGLAVAPPELPA